MLKKNLFGLLVGLVTYGLSTFTANATPLRMDYTVAHLGGGLNDFGLGLAGMGFVRKKRKSA